MIALRARLTSVEVTEPVRAGCLQVFGLRWPREEGLDYATLDEALAKGLFQVTEASEGGSVPTLRARNESDLMVFLMAGEQLIGAKQNRVLNASLMVAPRSQTPVPVSCVEAGRWGYRSRTFSSGGSASHAELRRKISSDVHFCYRSTGEARSNQGEVWSMIDRKMARMGTRSPSRALEQAYEDRRQSLDRILAEVCVPDDCAGVVFAFGGRIAGLDLFDRPATLRKLLPKLVRAYSLDALEAKGDAVVPREQVAEWLGALPPEETFERFASPGLGQDVRIRSPRHAGAALVVEERPVHVELFPGEEGE